ncbi:MAG: C1 family peptidase [Hungatella sp.]|nr:C1 family peptidase [Hungatella sp.]
MEQSVTVELLREFKEDFAADRANRAAMAAVTNGGIQEGMKNQEVFRKNIHTFSLTLDQGKVTSQKQSGRCWMFAAMNVLRFHLIHSLNLEDFELSQNYTLFYDKLEKSNHFLENILDTLDEPADGRVVSWILTSPLGDGGQWDMICSLIQKYGVVPKYAMPETHVSSMTKEMNGYLTEKLRGFACELRKRHAEGWDREKLQTEKAKMLKDIYRMLCICLGEPPLVFDFEVRGKDGAFHRDLGLTPQDFYKKYIGVDLDDYVSLIHAPTKDKPFHKSYTVQYLGNVVEGRQVRYLNLPIEELKRAAIAQLKDGNPVWFGCDVGKRSSREGGVMDLDVYRLEDMFGTAFPMTKAERLDYKQSKMTHAMVFVGVNLREDGTPNRWRVENSWGDDKGEKGFFVMDDAWFDEYMYQVVVHKKYLTEEEQKEYAQSPAILEPWDPMGSLA